MKEVKIGKLCGYTEDKPNGVYAKLFQLTVGEEIVIKSSLSTRIYQRVV